MSARRWDDVASVITRDMWDDGFDDGNPMVADVVPAVALRHICHDKKGSGGGTTYQNTTTHIPPEVLARYNAVNARAETVASQPFQPYYAEMTAPMMGSQQQALQGFVDAQGAYVPYFDAASSSLNSGTSAAMPFYDAASGTLNAGLGYGQQLGQQSLGTLGSAQSAANPLNSAAANNITNAQGQSSPYNTIAANSLLQAGNAAAPLQGKAVDQYGQALTQSSPYNTNATDLVNSGLAGAQPYNAQAGTGYQNALSTGQGYLDGATAYTLAGGNSVNPELFNQGQIDKYMSPYLSKVMDPTMELLQQQQAREQSSLMGNQMARGAFGGDRAGIGAANLAQQQNLATALTAGNLLNQGYGQALSTFQQQQGVNLGADQANRAALQQTGQTLGNLGQQGYAQQMGVAQGQQSLGQQVYGQGLGAGQAIAGIGNQIYNQQMGAGNANAQLGSQLYAQGANTSAQQAAIGNQIFNQGIGAANAQGQLANNVFGQGLAASQQQANVGNMMFNQGLGASQQQQALGQGLYGIGANNAQIQAGLGTAAQQNALAGASGLMGAGTVEQQTRQAYDTAQYNQFLQEQGYDFQTAQFLANIAMGTGALSGGSTNSTTTQPSSFFSDERLKENMREVGRTHDGQPIFAYNFPGEPTQIGLSAQKVERKHPEAVGESQGYKTVNYDLATQRAEKAGGGGLVPSGGMPGDLRDILAMQQAMFGAQLSGASARVPITPMQAPSQLNIAKPPEIRNQERRSGLGAAASGINEAVGLGRGIGSLYGAGKEAIVGTPGTKENPDGSGGLLGRAGKWNPEGGWLGKGASPAAAPTPTSGSVQSSPLPPPDKVAGLVPDDTRVSAADMFANGLDGPFFANRGGRAGYAAGGLPYAGGLGYVPEDATKPMDVDELKDKQKSMLPDAPGAPRGGGGSGKNGTGAALGTALGAAASFAVPGLGAVLGPIGGLLGGLFAEGGRVGYEGGGAPESEDDFYNNRIIKQESGGRHWDETGAPLRSKAGAVGAAQIMQGTAPEAYKLAGIEFNPDEFNRGRTGDPALDNQAMENNKKAGLAYFKKQVQDFGDPHVAAAAYNAGPGAVREALKRASTEGGNYLDYLPKETQSYVASVGGMSPTRTSADVAYNAPPAGLVPQPLQAQPAAPAKDRDFLDRTTDWLGRNERPIVSLLTGLGAMAGSPSRYAGSAILEGLGAAAGTYGSYGMKDRKLDIEQQGANTEAQRVKIAERAQLLTVFNQLKAMQAAQIRAYGKAAPELEQQLAQVSSMISGTGGVSAGPPGAPAATAAATPNSAPGPTQGIPYKAPSGPVTAQALPPPSAPPANETLPTKPPVPVPPPPPAGPPGPRPAEADIVTVKAEGMPTPPQATPEFLSKLDPEYNPNLLLDKAKAMYAYDPALAKVTEEQARNLQAQITEKGYGVGPGGTQVPLPGWDNFNAMRANVPKNQEWMNAENEAATKRAAARQNVNMIRDIVESYQTGASAEALAKMAAVGRSLGMEVPATAATDPVAFQSFVKDAYNNVLQSGAIGGTDALRGQVQGAFAGPTLQPEANKKILAQTLGQLNYEDKLAQETIRAIENNKGLDRTVFGNEWRKQNDPEKFREEAYKNMAVRGATPDDPKQLKNGHVYILEPEYAARFKMKINKPTKFRVERDASGKRELVEVQ